MIDALKFIILFPSFCHAMVTWDPCKVTLCNIKSITARQLKLKSQVMHQRPALMLESSLFELSQEIPPPAVLEVTDLETIGIDDLATLINLTKTTKTGFQMLASSQDYLYLIRINKNAQSIK